MISQCYSFRLSLWQSRICLPKARLEMKKTVWIKWLPLQCQSHERAVLALTASGRHTASSEAGQVFDFFPPHLYAVISFFTLPVLNFEQLLSFENQMKFLFPQFWLLYLKAQTQCQHWGSRWYPMFITFSRKPFGKNSKQNKIKTSETKCQMILTFPRDLEVVWVVFLEKGAILFLQVVRINYISSTTKNSILVDWIPYGTLKMPVAVASG